MRERDVVKVQVSDVKAKMAGALAYRPKKLMMLLCGGKLQERGGTEGRVYSVGGDTCSSLVREDLCQRPEAIEWIIEFVHREIR